MAGPILNDYNGATTILIPTTVQTADDVLTRWTSMTCLYDPAWVASNQGIITLPIAFFHVTDIRETHKNNVSLKRVMLYEPQLNLTAAEAANAVRSSVIKSLIDNTVREPKRYTITAIVPYQPLGRYVTETVNIVTDTLSNFMYTVGLTDEERFTGKASSSRQSINDVWSASFSVVSQTLKTIQTAANAAGKLANMDGVSYINKNSLDAMADSGHFLCMKMWTGFDYKFVLITDMEITKVPKEDDVFRATIQAVEVSVLSVTRPAVLNPSTTNRNWASKAISVTETAISKVLETAMGVDKAAPKVG